MTEAAVITALAVLFSLTLVALVALVAIVLLFIGLVKLKVISIQVHKKPPDLCQETAVIRKLINCCLSCKGRPRRACSAQHATTGTAHSQQQDVTATENNGADPEKPYVAVVLNPVYSLHDIVPSNGAAAGSTARHSRIADQEETDGNHDRAQLRLNTAPVAPNLKPKPHPRSLTLMKADGPLDQVRSSNPPTA